MKSPVRQGTYLALLQTGRAVQTGWLLFVLLALSLALPGLAPYREILQTVCMDQTCLTGQLTPTEVQAALNSTVTLPFYADILIIVHLFTGSLVLITAAALIWRQPTQRAAVCGAFVLAGLATGSLAKATANVVPALLLPSQFIQFVQLSALFPIFELIPDGRFRPNWLLYIALGIIPVSALVAFNIVEPNVSRVIAITLGLLILSRAIFRYRSLAASPQQEQAAWALAAVVLLAGAQWIGSPVRLLPLPSMPLDRLTGNYFLIFPVFGMLLIVGALTCLAVVFLSNELFRMDVALNRAFVYGLLTLFVIAGYVLVVGYLSLLFQSSGSIWFSLVATGVVAALFHPIRERLQHFVNRMLYGEQDDPYTVLAHLGQRLETAIASDEVIPTIVQTVREAFKVSYAAIALKQPGNEEFVAAAENGKPSRIVLELPLVYQNETVGLLKLSSRVGGERFSRTDQRLLNDLARQAGAAIHAASLNADLQRARQRLVTMREEERRRVRRDLHDGLGASLAALNLQAGELHRLIRSNPDEAERQVEELREEIRTAIADIRRLVYGLRPPALDELGLIEALRARAAQISSLPGLKETGQHTIVPRPLQVKVEAPENLPDLPAAVEAAVYRIVVEALTNTIQHARAEHCIIDIKAGTSGLTIEIYDDGIGMPQQFTFGIGLISMRERCSELGGTWSIQSIPGQGTQVSAWLPLPGDHSEEFDDVK